MNRAQIEDLIPHKGTMCLLDAVEHWDELTIRCRTEGHRRADNPLLRAGVLASVHLVEYGAQAMAIHGRLLELRKGHGPPKPGVLVTVRDAHFEVAHAQDIAAPLTVGATRLMGNPGGMLYAFEVHAGPRKLASGRVGVIHPPEMAATR